MTMKKILALLIVYIGLFNVIAHAHDGQKVASKVDKVIIFFVGAQVTRSATVSIIPGMSTITFENLSPDIDMQSIQVKGDGAFTILSVKTELNFLNTQTKRKMVSGLLAQQKLIKDKIELQTDMLSIYREEEDMLGKNKVITGQNVSLDILKLKQALDFQTQRLTELKQKEHLVTNQLALFNEEADKYNQQIAEITKGSSKNTTDVTITVSSKSALQAPFILSYMVQNAGWYPSYDIRAKNINTPLNIAYKANVTQNCGEDWKNIKLTLSTGNPSISGSKSELKPYYLYPNMVYSGQSENITRVTGTVRDNDGNALISGVAVKVKGSSIGTQTDLNGNYSLQVPQGSPILVFSYIGYVTQELSVFSPTINISLQAAQNQLSEYVVAGYGTLNGRLNDKSKVKSNNYMLATIPVEVAQTENQTNVEFNIENPYTIPGDGKKYNVEIGNFDLNATYQYFVAPKLNTDVFLTAQLVDWNKYNFLSGEANLFFEGTYIGKSLLDTHASSDTLNLSMGTDKNIIVTRTLQKALTQRQAIGSNKRETKDWLIDIKNRKSQPVNLLVEDQVPVSQNTSIEVEKQELSGGILNELDGKVQWTLKLAPADDKKLVLRYQVKYPKNQTVIVQ